MEQVFFAAAPCGTQTIRYYLLEEESEYGLLVTMGEEETAVHALTPARSRAQALLERMARGTVTPIAVRDVVDDWLLE